MTVSKKKEDMHALTKAFKAIREHFVCQDNCHVLLFDLRTALVDQLSFTLEQIVTVGLRVKI